MTDIALTTARVPFASYASTLRATTLWLGVAALGAAAVVFPAAPVSTILSLAALSLAVLALGLTVMIAVHWLRGVLTRRYLAAMIRHDPAVTVISDLDHVIAVINPAARAQVNAAPGRMLTDILAHHLTDPEGILAALGSRALTDGNAERQIVGARDVLCLTAMRYDDDLLIWRLRHSIHASDPATPQARTADPVSPPVPRATPGPETGAPDGPAEATFKTVRPFPFDPEEESGIPDKFYSLPVPILRIDRRGVIASASRRARQLLEDDQIVGRSLAQVVEGLGRPISEWLGDAMEGRGLLRPEVARTITGARDLYLQITLDQFEVGDEMHLIAVLHDATELKTLEAQFVQSQKMQAIGQLAGGVAHDFNNLLTAISGHCDLLLLRRDEADPDFADLEQINQNANRAASLVGQLLAFSRKQNLRPEFLDLRHTLADLTHLLNRLVGERVHLSFTHDPDLKLIRADKRQLEQVIMNLVVNARDAMPDGGEIQIVTEVKSLDSPFRRDRVELPAGTYVKVRVDDHGTGIPPEQLHKIFEPFFTTKKTGEGTGLGLSTAYGIVKQTGGFIFADSTPGVGSSFSLYFPAHAPEEIAPVVQPGRPATQVIHTGAGVVLLVEDEPPVRAFASRALRLRGYTVLEAENGEDALDILSDPALHVDIFVTDVIMPGLDGPGWVRRALEDRPDTRVIFVSGYSGENLTEAQTTIPNSVFLPKPFSLTQLTGVVHSQLS